MKGRVLMGKFTNSEKKQIVDLVKRTTEKLDLPTKKKEKSNSK